MLAKEVSPCKVTPLFWQKACLGPIWDVFKIMRKRAYPIKIYCQERMAHQICCFFDQNFDAGNGKSHVFPTIKHWEIGIIPMKVFT